MNRSLMKIMFPALALLGFLSPVIAKSAIGAGAASSIAYVSLQKIITESTDAKLGAARLEAMRQEKTREVNAKQKALESTHLQLVQAGGVFQASKRAQLKADEDRQRAELQRMSQQAQADLQNLQHQLQADLRRQLTSILDEITKHRRVQVVLNQDAAVVWATAGLDLTAEVLEKLNAAASTKAKRTEK